MAIWCDSGVNERVGPADEWVCDLVHETFMTTGVRLSTSCSREDRLHCVYTNDKDLVCRLGNGFLREQVYTIIVSTIMRI